MAAVNRLSAQASRSRAVIPVRGRLGGEAAVGFIQRVETLLAAGMMSIECDISAGAADWCTVAALLKASHLVRKRGGTLIVHTDDPDLRSTLRARGLASMVA